MRSFCGGAPIISRPVDQAASEFHHGLLVSCQPFQPFGGLTLVQIVVGLDERGRRNPQVQFPRAFPVASIRIDPGQVEPMDDALRIVLHRRFQQALRLVPARQTEDLCPQKPARESATVRLRA